MGRQITPVQFQSRTYPGEKNGVCGLPKSSPQKQPSPPSSDDTHFIVNLINDLKFILTQNSINYISATRTNSDKYQTKQLNANNNTHANKYDCAFSLNPSNFQSLSLFHSNSLNSNLFIANKISIQSNLSTKPKGLSPKLHQLIR